MNPFWGKWRITDGVTGSKVRPAAYKTGTTSDNKDVHAYGYLAPPKDKKPPALVAGIWMGNSDNTPNDGKLSLDTSAPLWSAILSDVSKGMPIDGFEPRQAEGPRRRRPSTRSPASSPAAHRARRSTSCSSRAPSRRSRTTSASGRRSTRRRASAGGRAASGRWSPGRSSTTATSRPAPGPGRRPTSPGRRARPAARASGRPEGHAHRLLLRRRVLPVRPDLGQQRLRADEARARSRRRPPTRASSLDPLDPCPDALARPTPSRRRPRRATATADGGDGELTARARDPTRPARAGRSSPRRHPRPARRAGGLHQRVVRGLRRAPRRAAPPCPGRG